MKIITFVFIFLLTLPIVIAEEPQITPEAEQSVKGLEDSVNPAIDATNKLAEKELKLPDWLQNTVEILFRFDGPLTISQGIIALMVFIIILVFFINAMQLFGMFSEQTATLVGIILALLVSMLGPVKLITSVLTDVGNAIVFVRNSQAGLVLAIIIGGVIIALIIKRIFAGLKQIKERKKMKAEGFNIGIKLGFVNSLANALKFWKKDDKEYSGGTSITGPGFD